MKLYSPPEIILASHIKSLGILDHSQALDLSIDTTAQFVPVIRPKNEGLIDPSFLSFSAVRGAYKYAGDHADSLNAILIDLQLRRALPDSFPPPLTQEILEPLCKSFGFDGLLVMEYFKVSFSDMPREIGLAERFKKGSLTVGWRIYDKKDYSVVFEDVFLQELPYIPNFNQENPGKSDQKVMQAVIQELGEMAGSTIINIISRTHIKGARKIFSGKFGPTDEIASDMKKAGEYAKENKWEAAMNLWNPVASHRGYGKSAGKAAYNMAIGCERLGNITLAIKWARTAQTQGVGEAISYLEMLRYRAGEL
ncbi:MAG: DUF6340 family protein [Bacteroidia bacterium]